MTARHALRRQHKQKSGAESQVRAMLCMIALDRMLTLPVVPEGRARDALTLWQDDLEWGLMQLTV